MKGDYITMFTRGSYYKLYRNGKIEKPDGYISDEYRSQFLGETTAETQRKLDIGEYEYDENLGKEGV